MHPVVPPQRPSRLARTPSPVLVLGGIASVQFGSALATQIFAQVGPGGAVLLRLVGASLVLSLVFHPRLGVRPRRDWALAALFGLVLAGMNLSFYEALHRIPLGIAVTIEFIGPLSVGVLGSRRRLDFVWAAAAVAGIVALTHGSAHGLSTLGVVFALGAAAMWGTYILVSARVGRVFTDTTGLVIAMWDSALVTAPLGIADGGAHLLTPSSLAIGGAVGILSSALPYTLELEALRRLAAHVFGVLMSLEPAVAAIAGWLVLGQGLSARELGGIALVMVASLGASIARPQPSADEPAGPAITDHV
ncbi:MAG: EamA family transporter [Candidatus Dormibacteria bacterium]